MSVERRAVTSSQQEVRLNYAWGWFQYHASQRFSAFNFFLFVVGALTVAYANAAAHHSRTLGAAIAVVGAFMAVGFAAIDVRNQQLVKYGQDELASVELYFVISITDRASTPRLGVSHRFWLRAMIGLFGVASLVATAWAIAGSNFGH
jgi:hypothetical protein